MMMILNLYCSLLLALSLTTARAYLNYWARNCKERGCCSEEFSNEICSANGPGQKSNNLCYCDSKCVRLKDCCEDFEEECKPIDCKLSEWSKWSPCSRSCATGEKVKKRRIIQKDEYGGKKCGKTIERRLCRGPCPDRLIGRSRSSVPETLNEIASVNLLKDKVHGATFDYLKNYYYTDPKVYGYKLKKYVSFCVFFKVAYVTETCKKSYNIGIRDYACVECDEKTQKNPKQRCRGLGKQNSMSYWRMVNDAKCQGYWTRYRHRLNCTCNMQSYSHALYFVH